MKYGNGQLSTYPPSPLRQQWSAFAIPPPPPRAADVICEQPPMTMVPMLTMLTMTMKMEMMLKMMLEDDVEDNVEDNVEDDDEDNDHDEDDDAFNAEFAQSTEV